MSLKLPHRSCQFFPWMGFCWKNCHRNKSCCQFGLTERSSKWIFPRGVRKNLLKRHSSDAMKCVIIICLLSSEQNVDRGKVFFTCCQMDAIKMSTNMTVRPLRRAGLIWLVENRDFRRLLWIIVMEESRRLIQTRSNQEDYHHLPEHCNAPKKTAARLSMAERDLSTCD